MTIKTGTNRAFDWVDTLYSTEMQNDELPELMYMELRSLVNKWDIHKDTLHVPMARVKKNHNSKILGTQFRQRVFTKHWVGAAHIIDQVKEYSDASNK